jgi:hypothetical protein
MIRQAVYPSKGRLSNSAYTGGQAPSACPNSLHRSDFRSNAVRTSSVYTVCISRITGRHGAAEAPGATGQGAGALARQGRRTCPRRPASECRAIAARVLPPDGAKSAAWKYPYGSPGSIPDEIGVCQYNPTPAGASGCGCFFWQPRQGRMRSSHGRKPVERKRRNALPYSFRQSPARGA